MEARRQGESDEIREGGVCFISSHHGRGDLERGISREFPSVPAAAAAAKAPPHVMRALEPHFTQESVSATAAIGPRQQHAGRPKNSAAIRPSIASTDHPKATASVRDARRRTQQLQGRGRARQLPQERVLWCLSPLIHPPRRPTFSHLLSGRTDMGIL